MIENRVGKKGIGFGAEVQGRDDVRAGASFNDLLPEDLNKFGLIPEFIGRLPVVATVEDLDREALVNILTDPKNALVKQYAKLFEMDGVDLVFDTDAIEAIADQAQLRGTGARGLRSIVEEVLLNTMYDLPSREDVGQVVITKEVVEERVNPTLVPHSETTTREERSA